jgi:hypothetical protein
MLEFGSKNRINGNGAARESLFGGTLERGSWAKTGVLAGTDLNARAMRLSTEMSGLGGSEPQTALWEAAS